METEQKQPAESVRKHKEFLFPGVVVLLFGLFAFQLWFHAARTSATVDEPVHILAGYRYWQCGDFGINPEHPPLLKLLATIPLMSKSLIQPAWACGSKINSKDDNLLAGYIFLAGNNPDGIVIPARLAAASMTLLLAALVFFAAREMFGRAAAAGALALLAFEPNLIAHGSLVTTDMALTATMFAAVYTLYRYLKKPTALGFLLVGLTTGLTLASKHSGVLILPVLFFLLIADILIFRKTEIKIALTNRLIGSVGTFAGAVIIGFFVLWACYGFQYHALPNSTANLVDGEYLGRTIRLIGQTRLLPESYMLGLADVIGNRSRPMILFGDVYPTGKWFYFPIAFAIKSSAALLILLPFGLLILKIYRQKRREMLFLLAPPLIYFAISMTSQMNIGVRHILPVYPFFIVIVAAGACFWARQYRIARYALIALLIFHAATAFRTAPNYIAFANDFWGGTANTYHLLHDSNVEWGQNLKLVSEYLARENIKDCWFAGYGGGEMARLMQPCRLLPGGFAWNNVEDPVETVPFAIEGTILLSVEVLPPRGGDDYLPIIQSKPVALIGGSVLVYHGRFEIPLITALSYAASAERNTRFNRFEEAVADARKAVEIAPNDARTHLELGTALARVNQTDEARRELEATIRLARSNLKEQSKSVNRAKEELEKLQ